MTATTDRAGSTPIARFTVRVSNPIATGEEARREARP